MFRLLKPSEKPLEKSKQKEHGSFTVPGLKIDQFEFPEADDSKILLPRTPYMFSQNDLGRLKREKNIQRRLGQMHAVRRIGDANGENSHILWPVKQLYAVPNSFSPSAPKTSRRSIMNFVASMPDGRFYPTTCGIDPYYRAPLLGEYEDNAVRFEEESEEELPRGSGRPNRGQFQMRDGMTKPGHNHGYGYLSPSAHTEGRNIMTLDESKKFTNKSLVHLLIPMSKLEKKTLERIATEMLLNTKGPFELARELSRPQIEKVIGNLLSCFGFEESAWEDGVRILTCLEDTMKSSYTQTGADEWTKFKDEFDKASSNIFKTPIFVDRSVIDRYWVCKPQAMGESENNAPQQLPRPKRPIDNVTVFESEAKIVHQEQPTLETIGEGVRKLRNLAEQVLEARGDSRKGILLEEHDELANELLEQITRLQILTKAELDDIKQEKMFVKQRLEDSKRLISGYEDDITDMQQKLDLLVAEKGSLAETVRNCEIQSTEITEENQKLKQELSEKTNVLNNKLKEMEDLMCMKQEMIIKTKEEKESMQEKLDDLSQRMEISLQMKEDIQETDIQLTDSVKKNRKRFSKIGCSPIALGQYNQAYLSDTDEETGMFQTPEKSFDEKKRNAHSLTAMTLTPNKIGLKAWDDSLQNFSQWFAAMRMQIEAGKALVDNEQAVIRLILMCLPSKFSWVTNAIADDSSITTISKAKKEILKMIYGERGLLEDFVNLKKSSVEHPNAFLQRIKTNLETSENLDSGFVLRMIEEKLVKNLDNSTNVEFQRLLNNTGRTNLTFAKLQTALQSAVRLTESSNNGNINQMGEHLLNAMNNMQKKMNRCFNCGSTDHFMNKCPESKGSYKKFKGKKKEASNRESKTKKDGRKCYNCGKEGHIKRNCPERR